MLICIHSTAHIEGKTHQVTRTSLVTNFKLLWKCYKVKSSHGTHNKLVFNLLNCEALKEALNMIL